MSEETTFQAAPAHFETGTPNIGNANGLGVGIDNVSRLGPRATGHYEHERLEYATAELSQIDRVRIIGTAREQVGLASFTRAARKLEGIK